MPLIVTPLTRIRLFELGTEEDSYLAAGFTLSYNLVSSLQIASSSAQKTQEFMDSLTLIPVLQGSLLQPIEGTLKI